MKVLETKIELVGGLSTDESNQFWDEFILEPIEGNKLQFGGLHHGIIEPDGNFTLEQEHWKIVNTWLLNHKLVKSFTVNFSEG